MIGNGAIISMQTCMPPRFPFYAAFHNSLWNAACTLVFRFSFIFVLKHKSNQLNIALNDFFFCHTLEHFDLLFSAPLCENFPLEQRHFAWFVCILHSFMEFHKCMQVNQLNNLLVRAHALFYAYGFVSSHSSIEVSMGFLLSLRFSFCKFITKIRGKIAKSVKQNAKIAFLSFCFKFIN